MKVVSLPEHFDIQSYTGISKAVVPAFVESLVLNGKEPLTFLFVRNQADVEHKASDIEFFCRQFSGNTDLEIFILPEMPESDEDHPRAFDLQCDRLAALTRLSDFRENTDNQNGQLVIVTTPRAFFHPVQDRSSLISREIRVRPGDTIVFQQLVEQLAGQLSYDCEAVCETPGQYSVRGGLIDVYPVNGDSPCRIDFFGDEIESIRPFDPTTQRSTGDLNELVIASWPTSEMKAREFHIFDYLADRINWCFWEPDILTQEFPGFFQYPEKIPASLPTFQDLILRREAFPDRWFSLSDIDADNTLFPKEIKTEELSTESLAQHRNFIFEDVFGTDRHQAEEESRRQFLQQINDWQHQNHAIICVMHNEAGKNRLQRIISEQPMLRHLDPVFLEGDLGEGFRVVFNRNDPFIGQTWTYRKSRKSIAGLVVVTDSEIFGRYRNRPIGLRRRKLPRRAQVDQLLDFSDLADGDYLVHLQHGICQYRGLTMMNLRGRDEEFITAEFDDGISLHLPLHESHLLTRYVGLAKIRPKLGRVGATVWDKTRKAAEQATLDFAAQLLEMQARRETIHGFAYSTDTEWQHEFENSFIHKETPDQYRAIIDAKADMEKKSPMDRLICGDVGFGKTEVAIRAAFKAAMDGRQVAILVPTTVLAQQHFITFKERMAEYPVVIEMLSRFRNSRQQKAIISQLESGKVDILIGTHRLLSLDVKFRDLGLLVVDEEHRFGVKHKERIKHIRENVDVINMSATPIPRTLYLALMGARDLSVIETPPVDRLPIHTVVRSYDQDMVKQAIEFEISRGGQVFYLHNRVQSIDAVALRLAAMLPELRIAIGHGQMSEHQLEKIMTRFVAGEFDVLVCTTIIESGLDIPNCNTIIIEGADRFGLSQLYQLRGRVGRFKRQAYAYLLLHRHTNILDQARKRLATMRQYNQLGAGFKIAMRDLELRGAGNLLGARQSGHIAGVGFELYCHLLRQSIARLKGDPMALRIRASIRLDFVVIGRGPDKSDGTISASLDRYEAIKADELAAHRTDTLEAYIPMEYMLES